MSARRAGFAAIIGAPNAGKSTLLNHLVGSKVAIVTHKAQTTRAPLRGIVMSGETQIVLVDTPGIFAPRRRLDAAMVAAAVSNAAEADAVVLLLDAAKRPALGEDDARALAGIAKVKAPVLLALNKVDAMPRPALLTIAAEISAQRAFAAVFMISAKSGDGVDALLEGIAALMPEGPWLYPPDQAADLPLRLLAAEITREQIYLKLHDELPYACAVETLSFEERKDGSVRIEQEIYVARESQRAIVLGKGGRTIKAIGEAARKTLEVALERKVHLFVHVKHHERWAEEPQHYRDIGLDFPKS